MMKSLKDLLQDANLSSPIMRGVRAAKVIEEAEKVLHDTFGPEIKQFAAPAYLKKDVLTVACLSSSAAQEIRLREKDILSALNRALGSQIVRTIRYLS